jgi:hypothetical protein
VPFLSIVNSDFAEVTSVSFSISGQIHIFTSNYLINSPLLASPCLKGSVLAHNLISRALIQFSLLDSTSGNWSILPLIFLLSSIDLVVFIFSSPNHYLFLNHSSHGKVSREEESTSSNGIRKWREGEGGRELLFACGCTWYS